MGANCSKMLAVLLPLLGLLNGIRVPYPNDWASLFNPLSKSSFWEAT